jgi:hypothetical protein
MIIQAELQEILLLVETLCNLSCPTSSGDDNARRQAALRFSGVFQQTGERQWLLAFSFGELHFTYELLCVFEHIS